MSELINTRASKNFRRQLFTTVSAFAFGAAVTGDVAASEGAHPTVWIELGGQLEQIDGGQELFAPPFAVDNHVPAPETISPLSLEHGPRRSVGGEAGVSIMPQGTSWVFSAALRYGRSNSHKTLHQQSYPAGYYVSVLGDPKFLHVLPGGAQFANTETKHSESHAIADFQAGKDVGLGLFGASGSSILNLGVRFAQFVSHSRIAINENPDWHFEHKYVSAPTSSGVVRIKFPNGQPFHSYAGNLDASRSFTGLGPSLSWKNATPITRGEDKALTFDWGINAALLFGRQKTRTHHQTTEMRHVGVFPSNPVTIVTVYKSPATPDHTRSKSVIVPNVGGFAGLSFRYDAAKVSFGYRADFFFGAMDGGIDARKTYDRNFYGPFATISIGLGG